MGFVEDILGKFDLKFEDLTAAERETLYSWQKSLESNALTIDMVKSFVHSLREGIENELARTNYDDEEDTFLKARLRNIILLEAFLTSPEKAKAALDRAIAGIAKNRK